MKIIDICKEGRISLIRYYYCSFSHQVSAIGAAQARCGGRKSGRPLVRLIIKLLYLVREPIVGTGSPGLVSSQVLTQTSSTYIPYRHVFQDVVVLCEWSSQAPGAPGSASPPIPPFFRFPGVGSESLILVLESFFFFFVIVHSKCSCIHLKFRENSKKWSFLLEFFIKVQYCSHVQIFPSPRSHYS